MGSLGLVPPLLRYCEALRLPAAPPASLRFLRFAVPPCASGFAPANVRRTIRGPGVVHRIPQTGLINGDDRTSQVPGGPHYVRALLSDPGETSVLGHCRTSGVVFRLLDDVDSHDYQTFRGSITRPAHSLSTLRRVGYPTATQDSLPAAGQPYRAGLVTRWVPAKGFRSSHPPSPSFAWRTQKYLKFL